MTGEEEVILFEDIYQTDIQDFFLMGKDYQRGDQNDTLEILILDYKQIVYLQKTNGEFSDKVFLYGSPPDL